MKSPCFFVALIVTIMAALAPPSRAADVYSVLDKLGPTVMNHQVTPNVRLVVEWNGFTPNLSLNGQVIQILDLRYDRDRISMVGVLPNLGGAFQATLSLNFSGNLVVQTSALNGTDGLRFIVSGVDGLVVAETCACSGGDATVTGRSCSNSECDDAGVSCAETPGGAALKYCKWITTAATPPTPSSPARPATPAVK